MIRAGALVAILAMCPPSTLAAQPLPAASPTETTEPGARGADAAEARYSRHRASWYIGLAVGGGAGWIRDNTADDTQIAAGLAFALIKVGWIARPWLLVGVEVSGWFHFEGNLWWSSTWVMTGHYDATVTYFPLLDHGFYVKGGVGLGLATVENYHAFFDRTDETTHRGFDLRLGLGHEWQLLSSFNLGAELVTGNVIFDGGRGHDLCAHLTFTWY